MIIRVVLPYLTDITKNDELREGLQVFQLSSHDHEYTVYIRKYELIKSCKSLFLDRKYVSKTARNQTNRLWGEDMDPLHRNCQLERVP